MECGTDNCSSVGGSETYGRKLVLKVSAHVLDVHNDAQRGTLSTWSWLSCVLTKLKANEVKNESFTLFVP